MPFFLGGLDKFSGLSVKFSMNSGRFESVLSDCQELVSLIMPAIESQYKLCPQLPFRLES